MQGEPDIEGRCLAVVIGLAETHILDPGARRRDGAPASLDLFALACPKNREHCITYELEDLAAALVDWRDAIVITGYP